MSVRVVVTVYTQLFYVYTLYSSGWFIIPWYRCM